MKNPLGDTQRGNAVCRGSSFAETPARIAQLEPGAPLLDGLSISRDNIQDVRQHIVDWVNGLK